MYGVIMVPTDGTGFDREAIRVALRIASRTSAKVKLVRVLSGAPFFGAGAGTEGSAVTSEVVRSERDRALSELYALAAECRTLTDAEISADLNAGPIAEVLADYARRHEVDLVVISTHGRTGLARLSLGSVTDSLIRHSSIPVLVVKPPTSYLNRASGRPFRHVVVPLDGSPLAEQILPRIIPFAKLEDAVITLLHVLHADARAESTINAGSTSSIAKQTDAWWDKDIELAQNYLVRLARRLRAHGTLVRTDIVVSRNVPDAIGDFAIREKADLIAIATHGRGGLARMLRGSVADSIMHSMKGSMLVFKPEGVPVQEEVVSFSARSLELLTT
jgi:nucleotide-binding universal stress UspA family protein